MLLALGKAYGFGCAIILLWGQYRIPVQGTMVQWLWFVFFVLYRWSVLPLEMLKGDYDLHKWSGECGFVVWKRVPMQKRQTDCIDDDMDSIPDCVIDRKKNQGRL